MHFAFFFFLFNVETEMSLRAATLLRSHGIHLKNSSCTGSTVFRRGEVMQHQLFPIILMDTNLHFIKHIQISASHLCSQSQTQKAM